MATKEELLTRIAELQVVRDSMRTKVELENTVKSLERQVEKLEEEIEWREQAFLNESSQRNDLLEVMDKMIEEADAQFEQECRTRKRSWRNPLPRWQRKLSISMASSRAPE